MLPVFIKTVGSFVLVSFLTIVLFGFTTMLHEPGEGMLNNCPFSSDSLFCPQDMMTMALHHISSYNSFFNAPTNLNTNILVMLVFLILTLNTIAVSFARQFLLNPLLCKVSIGNTQLAPYPYQKIIHWLSLFENSPSRY